MIKDRFFLTLGHKNIIYLSNHYWAKLKYRAKRRKLEFNITKDNLYCIFLEQQGRCALTGKKLTVSNKYGISRHDCNFSVDRINSKMGYVLDNIQLICKDINRMKANFDQNYFIENCKQIVQHNENCQKDLYYSVTV